MVGSVPPHTPAFVKEVACSLDLSSPRVGCSFFFLLNAYLHCGWTLGIVERTLPVVTLNSSAFHNVHHEKVTTHFGEISSLWDYLCGTSPIYEQGLAAGYRWHVERSQGGPSAPVATTVQTGKLD